MPCMWRSGCITADKRVLLNYFEQNGALLSNHHTPLISHTATDILTTLTGV